MWWRRRQAQNRRRVLRYSTKYGIIRVLVMSKREKDIEKLRRNPKNVRYAELESILLRSGFEKIPGKGSHTKFVLGDRILVVPFKKPFLKPLYVKQALQALDDIFAGESQEDEQHG
ncbi:type II toxin-antitoxin system HicA family toxin [Candidatus Parcubacteria bacterium]|nr:MAG: type II toxin-antitoxin system HicA family toxin [Candidatus Parcubacteria bacterium]